MFLAELLPPAAVARIVLVDTAWPLSTDAEPAEGQISWGHIHGPGPPGAAKRSQRFPV